MNDVMAQRPAEPVSGAFVPRLFSAIVLAVLALWATHVGGAAFYGIVAAGAVLLAWEWNRLCGAGAAFPVPMAVTMVALLAIVVLVAFGDRRWLPAAFGVGIAAVFLAGVGDRFGARDEGVGRDWYPAWAVGGFVYIALVGLALVHLRTAGDGGRATVYWLFACVWMSDSGAYAVGRLIGGPKLAPRISPKKTWAGFIGGTLLSGMAGAVVGGLFEAASWGSLAVASMGVAVISQMGDLFESGVKRHFNVKDSGTLIPGHGGLLDRVDGLMAASIAVWAADLIGGRSVLEWF